MSDVPPAEVRRTAVMTVLTVIAGAVDAVSFLALGKVFCALATGNVLFPAASSSGRAGHPAAGAAGTGTGADRDGAAVLVCAAASHAAGVRREGAGAQGRKPPRVVGVRRPGSPRSPRRCRRSPPCAPR
ncbi:DUF1275 family protein [Streptomyces pseudogriseolus]|uniref:DUF1275 family protein n=1 Tax=Streptomyces pseudogriseolus TaxID=36817 RepID=UPI003FA1BFA3